MELEETKELSQEQETQAQEDGYEVIENVCPDPEALLSSKDTLVIVTTEGCPACEELIQNIDKIEIKDEQKIPDEFIFTTSECKKVIEKFKIDKYPTVLRIKNIDGNVTIHSVEGYDIEGITKLINDEID